MEIGTGAQDIGTEASPIGTEAHEIGTEASPIGTGASPTATGAEASARLRTPSPTNAGGGPRDPPPAGVPSRGRGATCGLRRYSTVTKSVAPRPKVSGWYISSAFGGGTTKRPGVVARAT